MPGVVNGESQLGRTSSYHNGHSSFQRSTTLRETTSNVTVKLQRRSGVVSQIEVDTVGALLDYIGRERLRRMPHPGSKWDKVLQWAAYFASQLEGFSDMAEAFLSHSREATGIICRSCHQLLELGPSQAQILEQIFAVFYSFGSVFAFFQGKRELLATITEVHDSLSYTFSDVLSLVVDITAQYGQAGTSSTTDSSSITHTFGSRITTFYARKDIVVNSLWTYILTEERKPSQQLVDIQRIRSFLWYSDRTMRTLFPSQVGPNSSRAEFTCDWFARQLTDFTRSEDNLLVVAGKPGSGKSMLFSWIIERLQRAETLNVDSAISFTVEADIKASTSITAVLKGLLIQLLDLNIGNIAFYDMLSDALHSATQNRPTSEIDQALWRALEVGLHEAPNSVIVIDGADQLEGGETTSMRLLEQLHRLTEKHKHVKALVLSQPLTKNLPQKTRIFTIEQVHVQHDIRHCVEETIAATSQFRNLKYNDRERVVSRVSEKAEGSFVWAVISLELLKREKTVQGMVHALDGLPKSVNDSLKRLVSLINLKNADTRSLLAWLLAAQRPLTIAEIKVFLEIDLGTCSRKPRFSEIEHDVVTALGPIITIVNGAVRFRHQIIRSYFIQLASSVKDFSNTGDFPFMMKEAHYDLSTRCLAYTKLFVTSRVEPSFEPLSEDVLQDLFSQYVCFEYASTYWISHFHQSPMYETNGKHKLVAEFQNCFPTSVLLALVEWSTMSCSVTDYELVLYIRQTITGKQTMCSLQSLIAVAKGYERLSNSQKSSSFYYQAYELTQTLLGEEHDLIISCIAAYLLCSSTIKVTEKSEVYVQRETMLKRILTVYKRTRGVSHEVTIKYTRMLAQLYVDAKQMDLATTVYQELYAIYVEKYGRSHSETTSIYKRLIEVFEQSSKKEEVRKSIESERTDKTVSVTDRHRVASTMEMVQYYESRGETSRAESTLVELWRSISEKASTSSDTEIERRRNDVTIQYVHFLKRHSRTVEAHTVLEGLWTEYRNKEIRSDLVATTITTIGKEMKQFSLKTARSIFQSAHSYFERTQQLSSSEASEVTTEMQETTREIVESSLSSTTTTSTKTVVDESTLSEILHTTLSTLTTATSKTALSSVIKTCEQLSALYVLEGRWSEGFSVVSQTLATLWPYVVTGKGTVALPIDFRSEAIAIATRLGECLFHQHQIERAEEVYVRIFRGTKATLKLTDDLVAKTLNVVLDFYEQTFRDRKWIKIYSDMYEECKAQLGPSHVITIRIAYRIAEFCSQLNFPEAEHFWLEIHTALSKGEHVHTDATIAAKNLLIIYDRDARWDSAEKLCVTLWQTFVKRGTESKFTTEIVEKLYSVYAYILEEVRSVPYSEIYNLTLTYKETCIKVFGLRNELTLKATVRLAQICERSEERHEEAVATYEEACKHSTSITTTSTSHSITETIARSKQHLARLYSKQAVTTSKASSTSTEVFESSKSQYGWSDERTLQSISDLVTVNSKTQSQETTTQSLQILQMAIVETILNERSSEKLTKSATRIANSYIEIGRKETAIELVQEIRRQFVTGDFTTSKKFGISMKGTDRRSFVFVISLEQALGIVSKSSTFSELMAELTTETLLYQSYSESVKRKAEFKVIFEQGCRLLEFYQSRKRTVEYERIFTDVLEQFAISMNISKTSTTFRSFFELCIQEFNATNYETAVLLTVKAWILERTKHHRHLEAYDLASYVQKFLYANGGWATQQHVEAGLEICLYLLGRRGAGKCGDAKIYQSLLEISRSILKEVILAAKDLDIHFIQMRVDLINAIVSILGEQQNYVDLEWILLSLWNSRQMQNNWSSDVIVSIGRRLVEVRFAINKRDEAIHLCKDIIYNLRRVWGNFDHTTLDMVHLLAELYTSAGDHTKALQVHTEMLETTLVAVEEGYLGKEDRERAATNAQTEMELLKRTYVRNGGWGKESNGASIQTLYEQLASSLSGEKSFGKATQSVEKWSTKEKIDERGTWARPTSFEFYSEASNNAVKHENNLRITDGLEPTSPRRQAKNIALSQVIGAEHHRHSNGHQRQALAQVQTS